MKLKDKLIQARKRSGHTPHGLAVLAGVDSATIYKIESGTQKGIESITALKLATILDVTAGYLLGLPE